MSDDLPVHRPEPAAPAASRLLRDDAAAGSRALVVVRLASGAYLVHALLVLALPHEPPKFGDAAQVRLWAADTPGALLPPVLFWSVLAGVVAGLALQLVSRFRPAEGRHAVTLRWMTMTVMLAPFALVPLMLVVVPFPLTTLACIPSTAFVLVLLHHGQRFARLPAPMLVAAFGWGVLIVFGLGRACSALGVAAALSHVSGSGVLAFLHAWNRVLDFLALYSSVVLALSIGLGVVLLLLLFRHHVTDVVTGLVLGAAAGLGYSFADSVLSIELMGALSPFTGATGGFQYWIRQSIGLLGGYVTFGALIGAGLGMAAEARGRGRRAFLAGAGLVAAIGGATAAETLSGWLSQLADDQVRAGGPLDTLVISPLLWLLPQAPFLLLALLLLRSGWRARAAAAESAVMDEASAGVAVTEREARFLVDPALRFWAVVSAWRRYGRDTAWTLHRLQVAQLDLAAWRWGQQRGGSDAAADRREGECLRARVVLRRTAAATGVREIR